MDEDEYQTSEGQSELYELGYTGRVPVMGHDDKLKLIEILFRDPEDFCVTVLPNLFPKKMPWVHKGLLALVTGQVDWLLEKCTLEELDKIVRHFTWKVDADNPNEPEHPIFKVWMVDGKPVRIDMDRAQYMATIMPRGFSKTTLIGIAGMLYKILYQEHKFIVYVSETATAAATQLGNVKYELSANPMIHFLWGNLKPDRNSELKWTADMFQTTTGVVVASRGRGGQIRGMNVRGQRPDCILFDDVEDKESVKTEEQREKSRSWFYGDLMPALPRMDPKATIFGLGTILDREALLMTLHRDPEWTSLIFGAEDKDGDALWEDNMSIAQLEAKKKSYALAGMLPDFYREYMSQLRAAEKALFSGPFIIKPEWRGELDAISLVIDPAISEESKADYCAFGVVGIKPTGHLLVLDVHMERGMLPDKQVDKFYELDKIYTPTKHGVESIAYQKALVHLIRGEMFRRKRYFVIEEIKHGRTAKDERIRGILQARYANGYIAHARRFADYETQLLDYPNGKKDGPDVVAMAITLLDPYAANFADPESNDLEADEYEPLGDWQQY
jgi:hypothetical protein